MDRYHREALPLATEACRKALAESGLAPAEITHLVTVSCTGFAAPGVDVGLIKGLGLRPTTVRTNVGFMGCHGAINGLRAAAGYTGSDPKARVLLCCVELSSLHYYYGWNPKRMVGNALFADGAAAVVGTPADGGGRLDGGGHGSCLFPDSEHAMSWHVGDHGFDMTLSAKVPQPDPGQPAAVARGVARGERADHPGGRVVGHPPGRAEDPVLGRGVPWGCRPG